MTRGKNNRGGFTIVELLVVIVIIGVLATLTYAVFRTGAGSDKMRSAARIVQSAFLGAKDRALHAKDQRGLRMIRDIGNQNFVTGFAYVQPIPIQSTAPITIRFDANNSATDILLPANGWLLLDQSGVFPAQSMQVRIPSGSGGWYQLVRQNAAPPYWISTDAQGNPHLTLAAGFQGGNSPGSQVGDAVDPVSTPSLASLDVQLGNELLPFHQPVSLPSSVVVDLLGSSSQAQAIQTVTTNGDIMFSPRGMISGPLSAQGPLHFLLRDLQDATQTPAVTIGAATYSGGWIVGPVPKASTPLAADPNRNDRMVVTLFPQTGLVQSFEMDPTDNLDNSTIGTANPSGPPDGIADYPFNFAQQGRAAGR